MFITTLLFQVLSVLFLQTGRHPAQLHHGWELVHTELSSTWTVEHLLLEPLDSEHGWKTRPSFGSGLANIKDWSLHVDLDLLAAIQNRALSDLRSRDSLASGTAITDRLDAGRLIVGSTQPIVTASLGNSPRYAPDQYSSAPTTHLYFSRASSDLSGSGETGVVVLADNTPADNSGSGGLPGIGGGGLPGDGSGGPVLGGGNGSGGVGGGVDSTPEPTSTTLIITAGTFSQLRRRTRRNAIAIKRA